MHGRTAKSRETLAARQRRRKVHEEEETLRDDGGTGDGSRIVAVLFRYYGGSNYGYGLVY